jgi:hypothetical protein
MAFEWNPDKERAVYESWWTNTFYPQAEAEIRKGLNPKDPNITRNLYNLNQRKDQIFQRTYGGDYYQSQWTNYLNSYLQTEVEKSRQQAEVEKVAQQAQIAKAEQEYATAAKQAEISQLQAKRISAATDFESQQIVEQAQQASALAMQTQVQPVQQRKKTQIGQPGISRTRLTSGTTVGGYGGTSAGNISPTGLNI